MAINTFSIQFLLKKEKVNKEGLAPIVAKLFINGKKLEISTSRMLEPEFWSHEKKKAKCIFKELEELNLWIKMKRQKTGVSFSIPILQAALNILKKYLQNQQAGEPIFPVQCFRLHGGKYENKYNNALSKVVLKSHLPFFFMFLYAILQVPKETRSFSFTYFTYKG